MGREANFELPRHESGAHADALRTGSCHPAVMCCAVKRINEGGEREREGESDVLIIIASYK